MAIVTVTTPFNIDLEFRTAPFFKRLLAWSIDIVIICLYYYLMLRFIWPLVGKRETIGTVAELFIIIIPVLLYQLGFELLRNGQTIGKMVTGIKVIDKEGREPTWGQYIIRWVLCLGNLFIYVVPYLLMQNVVFLFVFMILYLPDALFMAISARSQRLGDMAAGSVVIDNNYRSDITETIYLQIEGDSYQPLYPAVMRLTDRDINGIRNLLHVKNPSKDTQHYMIDVSQKIKSVLGIESDMHPHDFLQQLLRDYNFLTMKN
ncbi:MAG: RDD family protein [Bacteroidota bacterium]